MTCTCTQHNHKLKLNRLLAGDPTRTTTLRNKFARALTSKFRSIKGDVRQSIIVNDALGLTDRTTKPATLVRFIGNAPLPKDAFRFATDQKKAEGFMLWLKEQMDAGVLEIVPGAPRTLAGSTQWMNVYIDSAYKRGIRRADEELKKAGYYKEETPAGIHSRRSVDAAFNLPVHADRVGLLYTRTFEELEGVCQATSQQISRTLAQGMAEGKGPRQIARELNDRIDKIGITRARTIARTEIIRAHHQATILQYRQAQVEGVRIKAEWSTAGDDRVCAFCADLEGKIFSLNEIEGMIPLHPNCRCCAIPANVGENLNL